MVVARPDCERVATVPGAVATGDRELGRDERLDERCLREPPQPRDELGLVLRPHQRADQNDLGNALADGRQCGFDRVDDRQRLADALADELAKGFGSFGV